MLGQWNLTYMPTLSLYAQLLFTFMSMLYVRESGNCCQSLSVRRPLHKPGFYFVFELLLFFFFNFNVDVKFYPTDWKLMGYWTRIGSKKKKKGDPFYGQTLCHTWVANPRYHCVVSSSWFYLSVGWWHEMYETQKQVGCGLVAKVKKKRLEMMSRWQANYEKRLHFFEDVSILLWHITTTTHNLY